MYLPFQMSFGRSLHHQFAPQAMSLADHSLNENWATGKQEEQWPLVTSLVLCKSARQPVSSWTTENKEEDNRKQPEDSLWSLLFTILHPFGSPFQTNDGLVPNPPRFSRGRFSPAGSGDGSAVPGRPLRGGLCWFGANAGPQRGGLHRRLHEKWLRPGPRRPRTSNGGLV